MGGQLTFSAIFPVQQFEASESWESMIVANDGEEFPGPRTLLSN